MPDRKNAEGAPLSLAFVTPAWPADAFPNGIATYTGSVAPALRRMGHDVAIIAGQVVNSADDFPVYDLSRFEHGPAARFGDAIARRLAPKRSVWRAHRRELLATVRRSVRERGVALLEMEETFGSAAWVSAAARVPVCVRLHGPWFLNGAANGAAEDTAYHERVSAEGRGIAAAAAVTAPSRDVLERTRAKYGLLLESAEVIPCPVTPPPAGTRWGQAPHEPNRILFVGRFDRHKGGDMVIDAFPHVLEALPEARLTFVGPDRGVMDPDGRWRTLPEWIERRLPGALGSGRIEWLGQQPSDAIPPLRLGAAVTVVASRYETFCYTAAEAMALGCPVVATRAGAIPELVVDGRNGLLCAPDSPPDLAAAIVRVLSTPGLASELGRQAALDCERLYHPDIIAERLTSFYRRVLAGA